MSSPDNITHIKGYSHSDRQKIIDDIGARAFLFLRDSSEEMGIPIKDIVVEHMLGLALVMSSVEGREQARDLLQYISTHLDDKIATLAFSSKVGEFSKINIDGKFKPFSSTKSLTLSGNLESIPLPSLSSYSEAYLGYHLDTGQYDHQFDINIENETITLKNDLALRELKLSAVDPDKQQPVERILDVPLDLALDMLRDGDDNISLDVPIEGRLDDPNINISSVINDALGRAVKTGAASYLKYAIQPYGAVFMAAEFVGDQMSAVTLDPIVYDSGLSEITAEHEAYIDKVSELMLERPKLTIKLCGLSNEKDKQIIAEKLTTPNPDKQGTMDNSVAEQKLIELAEQRSTQVKRLFIKNGVENRRVFSCQPKYKPDAINGVVMAI